MEIGSGRLPYSAPPTGPLEGGSFVALVIASTCIPRPANTSEIGNACPQASNAPANAPIPAESAKGPNPNSSWIVANCGVKQRFLLVNLHTRLALTFGVWSPGIPGG